uniref:Uncharacterized protein n=1 Tax=Trichobilharzia regenti TaxID=157069 RepID=A0AA85JFI6_TRIRE|nr:unnamed protein product [Trichobilharzia regenti]
MFREEFFVTSDGLLAFLLSAGLLNTKYSSPSLVSTLRNLFIVVRLLRLGGNFLEQLAEVLVILTSFDEALFTGVLVSKSVPSSIGRCGCCVVC